MSGVMSVMDCRRLKEGGGAVAIAADVRDVMEERLWGLPLTVTDEEEEDARDCTGEVDGEPDGETVAEFRFSFFALVVFRGALEVVTGAIDIVIVSSSCCCVCACSCCCCWWWYCCEGSDAKVVGAGAGGEGGANEFSMRKLQSS